MSLEGITAHEPQDLLVIYADAMPESSRYDRASLPDACMALMLEVVHRIGGPVAHRTGDGILAVFQRPEDGLQAAMELRESITEASRAGRFGGHGLSARIGAHFGPTLNDGQEVFGEGPLIATAVNHLAKPNQALCTEGAVLALPQDLSWNAVAIPGLKVTALSGAIPVYEMIAAADAERASLDTGQPASSPTYSRLELLHGGHTYVCDPDTPQLTLGRTSGNDVVVVSDLTSRKHARVALRQGSFFVEDNSANGTLFIPDHGDSFHLSDEEWPLSDSGLICLGGTADKNPEGLIRFKCVP